MQPTPDAPANVELDEPPAEWPGDVGTPLRTAGDVAWGDRPTSPARRPLFMEDAPFVYFAEGALWLGESYLDFYNRVQRGRHPYFLARAQLRGQAARVWRACVSQATLRTLEAQRWGELVRRRGAPSNTMTVERAGAEADERVAALRTAQRVPPGWHDGTPPARVARKRAEPARRATRDTQAGEVQWAPSP